VVERRFFAELIALENRLSRGYGDGQVERRFPGELIELENRLARGYGDGQAYPSSAATSTAATRTDFSAGTGQGLYLAYRSALL
jgi:hypothetical protein